MYKHQFELEIEKIEQANRKYEKERQRKIKKTLRWAKWRKFCLVLSNILK